MSFPNSPLADDIAARAAALLEGGEDLSRDDIVDRLLAEDGRGWTEDGWGPRYAKIVSEVMQGDRDVPRGPRR